MNQEFYRHPRENKIIEEDERTNAHEKLVSFLERIGLTNLSEAERIKNLKSMSYEKFYSLLERLNGISRKMPIHSRGKDTRTGLRITDPTDYDHIIVDYIPPENAETLLEKFFSEMKGNISEENIEKYSVKLRYAITFAHLFADANGRTSRYAEDILLNGNINIKDSASTSRAISGPSEMNKLAVFEIFTEELPDSYKTPAIVPKTPEDTTYFSWLISSMMTDAGYATPLKIIALIKTYPEKSPYDILISEKNSIYRRMSEEDRGRFNGYYLEMQNKLFWKVQSLLDKELETGNSENIDEIIKKKVAELNRN